MTWRVTQGSLRAKPGLCSTTGSSQPTVFSPTAAATTVDATGLETEASWKTVSGPTRPSAPAFRSPKPFRYSTSSSWTTPTATPGTPVLRMASRTTPSSRSTAASTLARVSLGGGWAGGTVGSGDAWAAATLWRRRRSCRNPYSHRRPGPRSGPVPQRSEGAGRAGDQGETCLPVKALPRRLSHLRAIRGTAARAAPNEWTRRYAIGGRPVRRVADGDVAVRARDRT